MIKAQPQDRPLVTNMLVQSFDDNKSVNYIIPQDRHRTRRIRRLMEYSFDYCRLFGEVYLSDDKQGCALIVYPLKARVTLRSILLDLRLILRCVGVARLRKVLQREAIIKKLHPREPFCYLWFIGVAPAVQQKGIGSTLLRELLDQCDQAGLPVYLETSVERNVPWYERMGFTVYDNL
ncbi:MAG TPA: GNAT family N-acetyltransferase, partial [Puia sp.]|nr:GNAT family N-acetyltransferase [Puia sp.]